MQVGIHDRGYHTGVNNLGQGRKLEHFVPKSIDQIRDPDKTAMSARPVIENDSVPVG